MTAEIHDQRFRQVVGGEIGFEKLAGGFKFTEGPAVNAKGEVFFTDIQNSRIHKIGLDGKVTVFAQNTGAANGTMFGPDGNLYACQNGAKRIAFDANGAGRMMAQQPFDGDGA